MSQGKGWLRIVKEGSRYHQDRGNTGRLPLPTPLPQLHCAAPYYSPPIYTSPPHGWPSQWNTLHHIGGPRLGHCPPSTFNQCSASVSHICLSVEPQSSSCSTVPVTVRRLMCFNVWSVDQAAICGEVCSPVLCLSVIIQMY